MFVIILYRSIAIRYKSIYSNKYISNPYSYMSNYVTSILCLKIDPIRL